MRKAQPDALLQAAQEAEVRNRPLQPGETVRIKGQTTVGTIEEIDGKNAIVTFGMMRTNVKPERLERAAAPIPGTEPGRHLRQQTDARQRVREKTEFQAGYRRTGHEGRRSHPCRHLFHRRCHIIGNIQGTHPARNGFGHLTHADSPVSAHGARRKRFQGRTRTVWRGRHHRSGFGLTSDRQICTVNRNYMLFFQRDKD